VLRLAAGTPLTSAHLSAVEALATDWHGQGPVALPGGASAVRADGRLRVRRG
jgi:tRNA(Ile)-lysidine synthase